MNELDGMELQRVWKTLCKNRNGVCSGCPMDGLGCRIAPMDWKDRDIDDRETTLRSIAEDWKPKTRKDVLFRLFPDATTRAVNGQVIPTACAGQLFAEDEAPEACSPKRCVACWDKEAPEEYQDEELREL